MVEFVYGSDQQYEALKEMLNDGMCHVYKNCTFPSCCRVPGGRLGFEKEGDTYALFIDRGNSCTGADVPELFREWLASGTLRFLDFTDMKEFLRSLRSLF